MVLPPLPTGTLVALLDAGAYGSVMSSNYNSRGRLAEVVKVMDEIRLARPAEPAALRSHDESIGDVGLVLGATIG